MPADGEGTGTFQAEGILLMSTAVLAAKHTPTYTFNHFSTHILSCFLSCTYNSKMSQLMHSRYLTYNLKSSFTFRKNIKHWSSFLWFLQYYCLQKYTKSDKWGGGGRISWDYSSLSSYILCNVLTDITPSSS